MYATEDDLKKRFGARQIDELKSMHEIEVTEGEEPEPVDVVEVALQDADEEINGYIGSRYSLPLANIPSSSHKLPTPEPVPTSTTDCAERVKARCLRYAPTPGVTSCAPISTPRARA